MSWFEQNKHKTPEQISAETAQVIQNDLYQPEKYREIIDIAETQGIGRDIVLSIAQQAMAAQYGDDINNAMARLDFVMQAVGQVRPDLEAEMRKNTIRAVRCLLHAHALHATNTEGSPT
ncbi:hypothetical protein HF285_04700 [Acidithiobacillus ferrooxidans F221]|uniref:hypothetical protein n=1 Tax=Acidithiobacillus ferrooxidans TaxID=920 RepID=UPI001C067523|nr:hypothetical protein [Acidithiobacillus ferrooxidans]MBU2807581.1 hypothetical protein [Acidithiobacillus ferrooxidans F221]